MILASIRTTRRRTAGAFSLVELLVVLGVIAVLIGLAAVGASHVRALADRASCAARLRQVGTATLGYATDHYRRLPTHHAGSLPFDTFAMQRSEGGLVNLGLLARRAPEAQIFYCPTQDADHSPELGFDTPANDWPGPGGGIPEDVDVPDEADSSGDGDDDGTQDGSTGQLNSSFAARVRSSSRGRPPSWRLTHYSNKVIYSDFTGVDGWPGGGRFSAPIEAPHEGNGYNRLFGGGAVQWAETEPLERRRPVGPQEPTERQMHGYYQAMDVIP